MRISKIRQIFAKEILDTFRDRRTLLVMIVIPILLYPALMIFVNEIATAQKAKMEQKKIHVALLNVPGDSPLLSRLIADGRLVVVSTENPLKDVRTGQVDYVLEMPRNAARILQKNQSLSVKLHFDQSNDNAVINVDRIHKIIEVYNKDLLRERLSDLNIDEDYVHPIRVSEVNVASQQKMGGFLIGRFLPMLMVIMVLAGAMYPAIDLTAGEKERGTLETIMTSPATKTEIVIGKFATVTLIAVLTGLLNMASMLATFAFALFRGQASPFQISIPIQFVFIMILCLVPLAVFFSGMMMAVASFARSFKEAQSFLTVIYIIAMQPAMVSIIPGVHLEGFWLTFPVANVTLLFKELMLGVFHPAHILIVLFTVTFLAAVGLYMAIQLFGREEVLFGDATSFGLTLKRANIIAKATPGSAETVLFIIISLALLLYLAIPLQAMDLVSGLVITEIVLFLTFPLLFAAYLKLDFRKTFRLSAPSAGSLLLTVLLFVGVELCVGTILFLQNQIMPIPKDLIDFMEKTLSDLQSYSFPVSLVLIALLPAICEEATFRGVILSGLLQRFRPRAAIIITAALFGVFHLSLHRFPGVFLIGLIASYIVWKSGSIFTGMLLHMLNNGFIAFLSRFPQFDYLGILEMKPSYPFFAIGLSLLAVALLLSQRSEISFTPRPTRV